MKKMIFLFMIFLLSATSAFATKARFDSLQNSAHLSDTREIFIKPDQASTYGEFVTMESGATAGTPNAEGGFSRKLGDNSALGAHLGNKEGLSQRALSLASAYTFKIQNPLNVYYSNKMGEKSWGLGFQYANSEDKKAMSKSSTMGLMASMTSSSGWDAQVALGLSGEATIADTTKVEQSLPLSLSGSYNMDTLTFYAGYEMIGAKTKASGTTTSNIDSSTMKLGVINSHKQDRSDFFYGIEYNSTLTKDKEGTKTKTETSKLPVLIGIEAEAAPWLVIRGSVSQSILIGSNKTSNDTSTTTETSLNDDTKFAGGLGLKLGKFIVDGALVASTTGRLGSDAAFLSNVGMIYKF